MECLKPVTVFPNNKKQVVPCSKCIPCLSNKRQDWIIRLNQEHKSSTGSLFITLTYDWDHMPKDGKLKKRDLQLFMKRLRKRSTDRLRYFACGEYGTRNGRPHYHLLLFNTDHIKRADIDCAWQGGITHVGQVTAASVAYVTKYIIQPKESDQFTLMSRAYGIGAYYLTDQMVAWHREDDRNYVVEYGQKKRLPRYYKDRIFPTSTTLRSGFKVFIVPNPQREKVSRLAYWQSIKEKRKLLRKVKKTHPKNAQQYIDLMRDRAIAKIRKKVAYTQTL